MGIAKEVQLSAAGQEPRDRSAKGYTPEDFPWPSTYVFGSTLLLSFSACTSRTPICTSSYNFVITYPNCRPMYASVWCAKYHDQHGFPYLRVQAPDEVPGVHEGVPQLLKSIHAQIAGL